jgi:hypothetical protein
VSGNSKDRRTFRRKIESAVVEKILGLQVASVEILQPSIWEWLWSWSTLSVAVALLFAVVGILLTTPSIMAVDVFLSCVVILILGKFFTWRVFREEKSKRAKLQSASIVVAFVSAITGLPAYINHHTSPFPIPWVISAYENNKGVGLQVGVLDYPVDFRKNKVGSLFSLSDFRIRIIKMESTNRGTQIVLTERNEWTATDANAVLAWVPLDNPVEVLEFWGSSQGAHWDGYLVLQKGKGQLSRIIAMEGIFSAGRKVVEVRETEEYGFDSSGNVIKTVKHKFDPMTEELLVSYGFH